MGKKYGIAKYGIDGCGYCLLGYQNFYFNPRPTQLDPSIKTLTGIRISLLIFPGIPLLVRLQLLFLGISFPKERQPMMQWHWKLRCRECMEVFITVQIVKWD